jgi:hypothetical protein
MDEMSTASSRAVAMPYPVNRTLVMPAYLVIIAGFAIMMIPFPGTGILGGLIAGFCGLILGIVNMVRGAVGAGIFQVILAVIGTPIVYALSWILLVGISAAAQ